MKVRVFQKIFKAIVILGTALLCLTGCHRQESSDELASLELSDDFSKEEQAKEAQQSGGQDAGKQEAFTEEGTIFVHVCGAVNHPGVYELKKDSRLYEAVACAGGARYDAAEEAVNQAQVLSDGQQIYIPTDTEAAGQDTGMAGQTENVTGSGNTGSKVNINTATREELMSLKGIGETRADSIIAYREKNGPFVSVEDLMQVEGIKEGVFIKIKDSITVNAGS